MSRRTTARRGVVWALVVPLSGVLLAVAQPAKANHRTVTAVEGGGYGYFASVSLFGGPANVRGPAPTVALAPDASNSPQTAAAASSLVQFGPAILLSTGPINVTTAGTLGTTGGVTTTATAGPVNTSGQEVFTAAGVSSTCTATEAGPVGSTTITGGTLVVSEGNPDVEGDETIVNVPTNPAPNTEIPGVIEGVGDSFIAVFNEQIVDPTDGSLTVTAYHLRLIGPTAVGDLYLAQSVCGVTTMVAPTTTSSSTTSTTAPTTTSSSTSSTIATTTSSSTSSTLATTTTTRPSTTTTTVPGACVPGEDGAKPGYGKGDKNHVHCGPPGQNGDRGGERALNSRPVTSTRPLPVWLIAGAGILFLSSLVIPFRRMKGDHSTKR